MRMALLFLKPVDEIESLTGLDFFCLLPEEIQSRVEAKSNRSDWNGLL